LWKIICGLHAAVSYHQPATICGKAVLRQNWVRAVTAWRIIGW